MHAAFLSFIDLISISCYGNYQSMNLLQTTQIYVHKELQKITDELQNRLQTTKNSFRTLLTMKPYQSINQSVSQSLFQAQPIMPIPSKCKRHAHVHKSQ